jgi:hypothetical protein
MVVIVCAFLCGCADDRGGYTIGACIAGALGDCKGAAWIEQYAETGDLGVDVVPRR